MRELLWRLLRRQRWRQLVLYTWFCLCAAAEERSYRVHEAVGSRVQLSVSSEWRRRPQIVLPPERSSHRAAPARLFLLQRMSPESSGGRRLLASLRRRHRQGCVLNVYALQDGVHRLNRRLDRMWLPGGYLRSQSLLNLRGHCLNGGLGLGDWHPVPVIDWHVEEATLAIWVTAADGPRAFIAVTAAPAAGDVLGSD